MLRCPPSQIHLTYEDIRGLEHRLAAKKEARRYHTASNARLVPGPRREIRRSIVPVNDNVAAKRADSVESQATLHASDGQIIEQWPISFISSPSSEWAVDAPPTAGHASTGQPLADFGSTHRSDNASQARLSSRVSSPRRRVDSMLRIDESIQSAESLPPYEERPSSDRLHLDGTDPHEPSQSLDDPDLPSMSTEQSKQTALGLGEEHCPDSRPPYSEPRALSSARARRFRPRSHDEHVFHRPPPVESPDSLRSRSPPRSDHIQHPSSRPQDVDIPPSVPEAVSIRPLLNPALDPGAPIFVPRIRFGSATTSVNELAGSQRGVHGTLSSIDSSLTVSQVRTRRSSELNVEQNLDSRNHPRARRLTDDDGAVHARPVHRARVLPRTTGDSGLVHRRASIVSDENGLRAAPNPNMERYPILHPTGNRHSPRITNGTLPTGLASAQNAPSRILSEAFSFTSQASYYPGSFRSHNQLEEDRTGRTNATSPAVSASSRSTPNLLQPTTHSPRTHSRGSSLTWRHHSREVTPSTQRTPSIVSAASGISDKSSIPEQRHVLRAERLDDSVAAILATRNSPLDELTERLASIAVHPRLRSVGRSFDRLRSERRARNLLSGSLFAPSSPPEQVGRVPAPGTASHATAENSATEDTPLTTAPTHVEMHSHSTSVFPSSSPYATINLQQSSSPNELPSPSSFVHHTPLHPHHPGSPPATNTATPMPTQSPRIRIYHDTPIAPTQPTTATNHDPTTHTRQRQRSQSHTEPPPPLPTITPTATTTRPPIPPRHAHRHTFPTNIVPPSPARRETPNHGDENGDEIEGHAMMLEADRRVWLARRELLEQGLEVTPPGRGRFEGFLEEDGEGG